MVQRNRRRPRSAGCTLAFWLNTGFSLVIMTDSVPAAGRTANGNSISRPFFNGHICMDRKDAVRM